MGLFDMFKKNNIKKPDISEIAYDYDGYDIAFESGKTEPKLYSEINNIVTNNNFDINNISEYKNLNINSDNDTFLTFYDSWLKELRKNNFVIYLDNCLNITDFANKINLLLEKINSDKKIDVNLIADKYKEELNKYSFMDNDIEDNFNYDVLEANIVAQELRKIGYELINFFIGFDNNDKTIIKIEDIDKLKEIETKIK
jgi:hypothetical protein